MAFAASEQTDDRQVLPVALKVLIAGARDHHFPNEGEILPIPYNSPLGSVLINRRAGDQFTAQINGNQQTITVVRVCRPTLPDILNIFPTLREV